MLFYIRLYDHLIPVLAVVICSLVELIDVIVGGLHSGQGTGRFCLQLSQCEII